MPIAVTMPALSPTMEEGTLARWLKQEGDSVNPGDVIAEIETDKATMEVEAVDEGVLGRIVVPEGTEGVKVNATIAWLLEEGEDASALPAAGEEDAAAKPEAASTEPEPEPESPPPAPAAPAAEPAPAAPAAETPAGTGEGAGERIAASPLARRMAKQAGLDLAGIAGSGPHGRIVKADIEKNLGGWRPGCRSCAHSGESACGAGSDARRTADRCCPGNPGGAAQQRPQGDRPAPHRGRPRHPADLPVGRHGDRPAAGRPERDQRSAGGDG